LVFLYYIETCVFIKVHQLIQLIRWHYFHNWLKHRLMHFQGYCVGTSQMSHSLEKWFLGVFCQKILSEFLALFAICISFKLLCNSCVWITVLHLWQFLLIDIMYVIPPHNGFVHKIYYRTVLMYEKLLEIWDTLIYVVCVPGTGNVYFFLSGPSRTQRREGRLWRYWTSRAHGSSWIAWSTCELLKIYSPILHVNISWVTQHMPSSVKSICIFSVSKIVVVMHM
jgi:hypothetical protein